LAVHFEQGRNYRKAVQYLQQAGERAIRRSAYGGAISHLTKGLELLKHLPDTPERGELELRLLRPLGPALASTKGFAAPEVEYTYKDKSRTSPREVTGKSKASPRAKEVASYQFSVVSSQPLTPSTQEAEACFLKALEVSRHQQAKSLELRATMSLARLWQSQGKKDVVLVPFRF
jgi:predicted ATPase